jgi:hypothetical protein
MSDLIRVPSKLARVEKPDPIPFDLVPLSCESWLHPISQPTANSTDGLAIKLFAIAAGSLGAIGLVIIGLFIGHSSAPTAQPSPSIVVVPAPAPVQQSSKSSCLVLCSN